MNTDEHGVFEFEIHLHTEACVYHESSVVGFMHTKSRNEEPSSCRMSVSGIPLGQYHLFLTCMIGFRPCFLISRTIVGEPNQESVIMILPEYNHGLVSLQTVEIVSCRIDHQTLVEERRQRRRLE